MKLILPVLFLLVAFAAGGQSDETPGSPGALFKIVPQNLFENELKIGVEFFNKKRSKSYSLYIYGRLESNDQSQPYYYDDPNYKGLGSEFQYRKYISPVSAYKTKKGKNYLQGIYVSGYLQGASYINEGDFIYYSYDQNTGIQSSNIVSVTESVGNVGTGFTIGVQRTLWNVLFIDVYVGGGIQWSDVDRTTTPPISSLPNYYYYGYSITDPGYQGIMPKFGLQLGVAL